MFLSRVFLESPRDEKSISRAREGRGKYRWNDFVFGSGQGPGGTHGLWWERAASSDPLPSTPSLPVQGALWQSFLPSTRTPRILHGGWLCQIPKYVPHGTLEASLCEFFQSPGSPQWVEVARRAHESKCIDAIRLWNLALLSFL